MNGHLYRKNGFRAVSEHKRCLSGGSLLSSAEVPQDAVQLVCLVTLGVIEFFLNTMEDGFVGYLGLSISLGMRHSREASLTAQATEIISKLTGIELSAVVEDHCAGDAESGDNISPDKLSHFCSGNRGDGLNLDPLGEVVCSHKEIFALVRGPGKGPRMSMPQVVNGSGLTIGVMRVEETRWTGANR